jgi:signal transduction histidine kinase
MNFWRQLRWRIVVGHMAVVLVGVTTLILAVEVIISRIGPADIQPSLLALLETGEAAAIDLVKQELVETFRRAVVRALLVAGGGAALMGLLASFWLAWQILRPLNQIAHSSQRIAEGRYDERISLPSSDELAQVATHFNQMAAALQEVEAQRVALIGNVAHELRTPLSGLAGYLEGVMDGVLPNDPETFAAMYQETRRLRRLVDDLQALSRVESGQISLQLQPVALVPLLERVATQVRPQAEGHCLLLETDFSGAAELQVQADVDRVAQIVLNLLSNAIRYTPQGGCIQIKAGLMSAEQPATTLPTAYVDVCDDGIGLAAADLPYLFERFYRVDPSRSRHSGGSGIGLTIARHLAWAMGGELTAHSDGLGKGSRFRLTLPVA